MITISNAQSIDGQVIELTLPSASDYHLNASGLTVFPGLIDPHVHFRTPGMEHKEDWCTGAKAAICGGYTTVFDMPNTIPPTITAELLQAKKKLIDTQLQAVNIPLRYQLFFGADKHHFSEIDRVKDEIIGIKVFMGCSTGNLVIDDDESLHQVFEIAASLNLLVAVHAEDEKRILARKKQYQTAKNYSDHSMIRDSETAVIAVEKAIQLSKMYKTRLYILHVSTQEEIALIKQAKQSGLSVYAETTPHHLFLNESAYLSLHGKAVVNPPLRAAHHQTELFRAIKEGVIDTIGSDHAPHTHEEKAKEYGVCPSGMPGIETTLPLLLSAYHEGLLSLDEIMSLTVKRPEAIFNLKANQDIILVDLNKKLTVSPQQLQTKCAWSPYEGRLLQGWPVYTIMQGHCFDINEIKNVKI